MEVIAMSNINSSIKHAENLFEDYPDIVKVEQLKTMLPKMGKIKYINYCKKTRYTQKKLEEIIIFPKQVLSSI